MESQMREDRVLYVYRCAVCGYHGEAHFADDSHDGEATICVACGATVRLEWDGGVMLIRPLPPS